MSRNRHDSRIATSGHRSHVAPELAIEDDLLIRLSLRLLCCLRLHTLLFELGIRGDAARALQLIRQSWALLREPVDARLYLRAAIAAKEPTATLPVQDWLRKSGLQDARLTPELAAVQKLATSP